MTNQDNTLQISNVSPETAKSIQEVAKASSKALDVMNAFGKWVGKAIDDLPENLVGVMGGNWLREYRIQKIDQLTRRTTQILKDRDSKYEPRKANPSFLVSIFNSACDDNRTEIQEIWARLIANALDGSRPNIRKSFIIIVNELDEYDALILQELSKSPNIRDNLIYERQYINGKNYYHISRDIGLTIDQWEVSMDQLNALGLLEVRSQSHVTTGMDYIPYYTKLSALGREFINACRI